MGCHSPYSLFGSDHQQLKLIAAPDGPFQHQSGDVCKRQEQEQTAAQIFSLLLKVVTGAVELVEPRSCSGGAAQSHTSRRHVLWSVVVVFWRFTKGQLSKSAGDSTASPADLTIPNAP
eukprot:571918-Amphidinium_carterae.1